MSADAAIARLASTQAGNVTFAQLREHGLSEKAIRTRAARGSLVRRFRGVYAVGHVPQQWFSLAFAAWLACGRASALSGTASAAALGVLPEPAGPVHLTRPTAGASQPGLVLHQGELEGDVWHRRGLAVTSPARLMLELAASQPFSVLERAYNEAQVHRLLQPSLLGARLEGWAGRRGVTALRELLVGHGVTRSWLEDGYKAILREAVLPTPEWNQWIDGVLVDAVWRQERVVVELDGRGFHDTDVRFDTDRSKSNALLLRGWLPLRFTYGHLTRQRAWVIATTAGALSLRGDRRAA